jgi:hypothetical protein
MRRTPFLCDKDPTNSQNESKAAGAERGGSHLQQHKDFTIGPCRDLVSRRGRLELSIKGSCLGSRRER